MTCASLRRASTPLVTLALNASLRAGSRLGACWASGAVEASVSAKSAVAVLIFMAGLPALAGRGSTLGPGGGVSTQSAGVLRTHLSVRPRGSGGPRLGPRLGGL